MAAATQTDLQIQGSKLIVSCDLDPSVSQSKPLYQLFKDTFAEVETILSNSTVIKRDYSKEKVTYDDKSLLSIQLERNSFYLRSNYFSSCPFNKTFDKSAVFSQIKQANVPVNEKIKAFFLFNVRHILSKAMLAGNGLLNKKDIISDSSNIEEVDSFLIKKFTISIADVRAAGSIRNIAAIKMLFDACTTHAEVENLVVEYGTSGITAHAVKLIKDASNPVIQSLLNYSLDNSLIQHVQPEAVPELSVDKLAYISAQQVPYVLNHKIHSLNPKFVPDLTTAQLPHAEKDQIKAMRWSQLLHAAPREIKKNATKRQKVIYWTVTIASAIFHALLSLVILPVTLASKTVRHKLTPPMTRFVKACCA